MVELLVTMTAPPRSVSSLCRSPQLPTTKGTARRMAAIVHADPPNVASRLRIVLPPRVQNWGSSCRCASAAFVSPPRDMGRQSPDNFRCALQAPTLEQCGDHFSSGAEPER